MTTKKSTKRALLTSVAIIALCLVMLMGITFAWFTDTASTGVNKITSGNLHVEIQDANNKKIESLAWVKENGTAIADQENILWEPGCTYLLASFKIANTGNLALKYKINVEGLDGKSELLKVIDFTYQDGNKEAVDINKEGHLAAKGAEGATSGLITVRAHMDEAAGNEYQDKTLNGVKITVLATQDTVENDSYGNQYDANAGYPAADADQAQAALANGDNVTFVGEITPAQTLVADGVTATLTADDDAVIANNEDIWDGRPNDWSLVSARNGANLTIDGGTYKALENDCYAVDVQDENAVVTIKSGTFVGNIHAVYVESGTAIIEGGFYSVQQKYPDASLADEFVLNCYDANRANGTAHIIVKGGTFVNFNPADCKAEGAGTNFVAEGYKVVSEAHGADTWYTVVKA